MVSTPSPSSSLRHCSIIPRSGASREKSLLCKSKWFYPIVAICCVVALGNGIYQYKETNSSFTNQTISVLLVKSTKSAKKSAENLSSSNTPPAASVYASAVTDMVERFELAREQLTARLINDYGEEAFRKLFTMNRTNRETNITTTDSTTRKLFKSPSFNSTNSGISWDRMKRKVTIKLLQALLKSTTESTAAAKAHVSTIPTSTNIPFIWATGGHSAAAAHGNFYRESYTAVLERRVRSIFAAVRMDFVGRNHAMGGTGCAPEIAMCLQSVFGNDVDVLVWDYGMTDGRDYWKQELYMSRSAVRTGSRPVHVAMNMADKAKLDPRVLSMRALEENGIAAVYMDSHVWTHDILPNGVPDCEAIMMATNSSASVLERMPKYIRNLRCGSNYEKGAYCGTQKWSQPLNDTACIKRKAKTSWHPGWKMHALRGNHLAIFLTDILQEAIHDMVSSIIGNSIDPSSLLSALKAQEDSDYRRFYEADLPPHSDMVLDKDLTTLALADEDDANLLKIMFLQPNICHIARLPAQIRYEGILTETTEKVGMFNDAYDLTYDLGIEINDAISEPNPRHEMRLVYERSDRQTCPIPVNMDYRDYFYLTATEGEKHLLLPNDMEVKAYRQSTSQNFFGLVGICLVQCPMKGCRAGHLTMADIAAGTKVQLTVNQNPVLNITNLRGCGLLRGENGHYWESSNQNKFDVAARVIDNHSFLQLSSVILW